MALLQPTLNVHLRTDRSITQFLQENVCNTDHQKVILEDTLTPKRLTYGGIREDAYRLAQVLRADHGLQRNDVVTIISRSCVSTQKGPMLKPNI